MQRYSKLMIVLHWTIAVLIVAAYLTSEGGRRARLDPPVLHMALGLSVLLLLLPRLLWRFIVGIPPAVPHGRLLDLASRMGHATLYLLMIAIPLTGWYAASRLGIKVTFLGLQLPDLTTAVQGAPGLITELHQTGGNLLLILAGLHGVAALWHHFILRDGTLARMNPV